jgi:hypothetical protein
MPMTVNEFIRALSSQDYEAIRMAIDEGFDVNTAITGKRPLVEIAQTGKNMAILRMLWEAGATPSTPWLETLFARFAAGTFHASDYARVDPCQQPGTVDLTASFSVARLEFIWGRLNFAAAESSIELAIKPFILDGDCAVTSVRADFIPFPASLDRLSKQTFTFPINPDDGYIDASIYLRDAHNPVHITRIEFGPLAKDRTAIDAVLHMFFDFEDEMTELANESLILPLRLAIQVGQAASS